MFKDLKIQRLAQRASLVDCPRRTWLQDPSVARKPGLGPMTFALENQVEAQINKNTCGPEKHVAAHPKFAFPYRRSLLERPFGELNPPTAPARRVTGTAWGARLSAGALRALGFLSVAKSAPLLRVAFSSYFFFLKFFLVA